MGTYYDPTARGIGGLALLTIFLAILGIPFIWKSLIFGFSASIAGFLVGMIGWLRLPKDRRSMGGFTLLVGAGLAVLTFLLNVAVVLGWLPRYVIPTIG